MINAKDSFCHCFYILRDNEMEMLANLFMLPITHVTEAS